MENKIVNNPNIIVIGAGPAGMMAAISVKRERPGASILVIDQTFEPGRKLLVAGAGRGNLTNKNLASGPLKYYSGDREVISAVFSQFSYQQIIDFFTDLGIPLYEEIKTGRGKIFPVINSAKTVREILVDYLDEQGVTFLCNTKIRFLEFENNLWHARSDSDEWTAKSVAVATGGRTYPSLGADGSGYDLARDLGHRIVEPVPTAVQLVGKNQLSHFLQGETVRMGVTAKIGNDHPESVVGDVLFTNYGLSGSAILDVSRPVSVRLHRENKHDAVLYLSFFPELTEPEIRDFLMRQIHAFKNRPASRILWGVLTQRAANAVCACAQISKECKAGELTQDHIGKLIGILNAYPVAVEQTRGWNESEFTAGGVDTHDIDPHTLESRIHKGLFFAGEILDVDGQVGGFNLSWAWASGWVAGKHASRNI